MGYMKGTFRSAKPINDWLEGLLFELTDETGEKNSKTRAEFDSISTLKVDQIEEGKLEAVFLAEFKLQRPASMSLDDALKSLRYETRHKAEPMGRFKRSFSELVTRDA